MIIEYGLLREDGEGELLSPIEWQAKWTRCAHCGRKPESTEPLPDGWTWDNCDRFRSDAWCDVCNAEFERPITPEEFLEWFGCTEAEWDAMTEEQRVDHMWG